jgi:glutamate--cysteine ligase
MVFCALRDSDPISIRDQSEIDHNQQAVATRGRQPRLELRRRGRDLALREWAEEICAALEGICTLLDAGDADAPYARSLERQRRAIAEPELLPSARMLSEMKAANESFFQYAMRLSRQHRDHFKSTHLSDEKREGFETEASRSLAAQRDIEGADAMSFSEYLENYFKQSAYSDKALST